MNLKIISCGKLQTNSYVVYNDKDAIVIDAPDGIQRVIDFIKEKNLNLKALLLTHGHFDHIAGAKDLKDMGAKVYLHELDVFKIKEDEPMAKMLNVQVKEFDVDNVIKNEGKINIEGIEVEVIFTPGHTKGGVIYIIDDLVFAGDTMFKDSFGRYDFIDSNPTQLKASLIKMYNLNERYFVYPGHGDYTTIKREKTNNLARYI